MAALDTNGNNIAINGSDTLFDVTQQVLSGCPGATGNGITYQGGGSGVGASQMGLNNQRIAPMSRALKSGEYCAIPAPASNANTEALLVGIDGVSVVANKATSCSNTSGVAPNLGIGSFSVNGTPYNVADSFDVLKLLYFGLDHNGNYDCNGATRRALVAAWTNLFNTDCAAGDGICTKGLQHAWRRGDTSGTTDAFVSILNPPGGNGNNGKPAGLSVGLGTMSSVPVGKTKKSNPFCNTQDANQGTTSFLDEGTIPAPAGFSYSAATPGDMQDLDPIKTTANPLTATTGDSIARGRVTTFNGALGLVLPIFLPDANSTLPSDVYPAAACSTSCDLVAPIKSNQIPVGYLCPDGNAPVLGQCYQPFIAGSSPHDPRCISTASTRCFGVSTTQDGRAYNMPVIVAATQVPTAQRNASTPFQYAIDANKRIISSAFYRIHMQHPAPNAAPDSSVGQTGVCQENDDTSQIGCLVDADRCSVGFAGREAAKDYPGLSTGPVPEPLKAFAVTGGGVSSFTPPFTPGGDPDLALKNLLQPAGTTPFYPIARRLYVATLTGFGSGQFAGSGEAALVSCYSNSTNVGNAITQHGFVAIPGGLQCLDYPAESASAATPAPNVQGSGNVALGGCGSGGTANDACSGPTAPTITP